ncbi:MAG TPA: R3H domain-containing nucleic acid-binding protein [Candidatus Limnocylindrales bacterium]|nr:R3H domain-containing nucleic acid-binding protein [Candidatus Limnocylindrales bacterium]
MLQDKVAAAKKIDVLLRNVIASGAFKLKYRITVNPPVAVRQELAAPDILVELAGPDSSLVLERGGELLRSLETIAHEALHLHAEDHDRVAFDCRGYRAARQNELKLAAEVAAEKVLRSGVPYSFAPMSSRERRLIHLAFRDHESLTTQSEGEGGRRYVVLYPKDYKPARPARR